jgi:hypothetical protein
MKIIKEVIKMATTYNYKNLGAAIVLQAVKDIFDPYFTRESTETILKNLRSQHLIQLSDGLSVVVAEQIEKHPFEIAERLGRLKEEVPEELEWM